MIDFLQLIVSPGMLIYTTLLALAVTYWTFVMLTGLEFGEAGLDGAAEGALDGASEGASDGIGASVEGGSPLGGIANFLHIGAVPVTLTATFIIMKMWFLALLYNAFLRPLLGPYLGTAALAGIVAVAVAAIIIVASAILTSITTKPLRKRLAHKAIRGQHHLVGTTCAITSARVTDRSGQAELIRDGGSIIIMVQCKDENSLRKGSEAIIVGYTAEKNIYQVRPLY